MSERIGKYLQVEHHPPHGERKTSGWTVLANDGGMLGIVRWYGPWRQYTFEPSAGTVFSAGCLKDLTAFLERVNREHKAATAEKAVV